MSSLYIQTIYTQCLHIFLLQSCSHYKQLNGDLISITFVMLVLQEQVALMSSSQSETCLLLYISPCHCTYLCSTIIFVVTTICKQQALLKVNTTCVLVYEVNTTCVPIYIFGLHHKQCASDQKDFTFEKFNTQLLVALMSPLRTKRLCYCSELVCQ